MVSHRSKVIGRMQSELEIISGKKGSSNDGALVATIVRGIVIRSITLSLAHAGQQKQSARE